MVITIIHDKATFNIIYKKGITMNAMSLNDVKIKLNIDEKGWVKYDSLYVDKKDVDEYMRLKDLSTELYTGLKKAFDIQRKM